MHKLGRALMDDSIAASIELRRREDRFFLAYAVLLLAIVFVGFSPSLFLRVAFENPPIPFYLHLHGAILTGWFVWLVAQAWLVQSGNVSLHRRLGYFAAAYGLIVVAGGLMATLNAVSRDLGMGITFDLDIAEIDPTLGSGISYLTFISSVVWGNIVSVFSFAALICAAVVLRRRPDFHKRFILVGTVSILAPALARISRYEVLGGEQGPFINLVLLSLLAAILIYDLAVLRKIHKASLAAIGFAIALSAVGTMISQSDFGQEFVRGLA